MTELNTQVVDAVASLIDHTVLKETATPQDITRACMDAKRWGFAGVCVRPQYVCLTSELLKDSTVIPITVIGFPSGEFSTEEKVAQTMQAIEDGAREIDMVLHIGRLKDKDFEYVYHDIKCVIATALKTSVKVILETNVLTLAEKVSACALAKAAGAAFVKTSTGYNGPGATVEDVQLLRSTVGIDMGVKASGGIRSPVDFQNMVTAGATRIGTSHGVMIVEAMKSPLSKLGLGGSGAIRDGSY